MNPELERRLRRYGQRVDAAADAAETRHAASAAASSGVVAELDNVVALGRRPNHVHRMLRALAVAAAAVAVVAAGVVTLARSGPSTGIAEGPVIPARSPDSQSLLPATTAPRPTPPRTVSTTVPAAAVDTAVEVRSTEEQLPPSETRPPSETLPPATVPPAEIVPPRETLPPAIESPGEVLVSGETLAPATVPPGETLPPGEPLPPATVPPGETLPPAPPPACTDYTPTNDYHLDICDSGAAVRLAQESLKASVDSSLHVDGYFGLATENAVRTFQQLNGLEIDGQIGPATWRLLVPHAQGTDADGNGVVDPSEIATG